MARSSIEHELDRMIQEWASQQPSVYSGKRGCVGHHIYSRSNKMLRWDIKNIAPLTPEEHRKLHDGKIYLIIDYHTQQYLDEMMRIQFKDFLIANCMTENDFYKQERKKLQNLLVDKYMYKSCIRC